jgi:hypothetical protein
MKRSSAIQKSLLADPFALAAACVISFLFANTTQQYLNIVKRNSDQPKSRTVVCFQASEESPGDRPEVWKITTTHQQKKNFNTPVTFTGAADYEVRLRGYFIGHDQPSVWLPSIPIAHRKLII